MAVFKCKMCGGALEVDENLSVGVCPYCGTQQTFPRLDNERTTNLYDRANHFRRNNEFDKAMGIYEQLLNDNNTDSEAYWSLVLCRYGIEYVEDPASQKRVPTVNRAQFTAIFDDEDYKSALQYADSYQRSVYEAEAKAINEIQKGILAISQKEEPFDVFICYKETDDLGRRTQDSVLANDLYHQLVREGFKVFFARITLEDKLGSAYEPYIFAALNSAKVMVVLGTRPEFFNAVWVKNEWSRYLSLVKKSGGQKILIPAYKDMDPYDLPEEFSHLQAQDMSKLGFMQDLIRGIKKITRTESDESAAGKENVAAGANVNVDLLLKRVFLFLEDGDWRSANEYCEKVLDAEPENAQAYLGKLMVGFKARTIESLADCEKPFDNNVNYQKVIRFGSEGLVTALKEYNDIAKARNEYARCEKIYNRALEKMKKGVTDTNYTEAAALFESIRHHEDSANLSKLCYEYAGYAQKDAVLVEAKKRVTGGKIANYKSALSLLKTIPGWRDADKLTDECHKRIEEIMAEREAVEKKAKKRKRNFKIVSLSLVLAVVLFIVLALVVVFGIIPANKYKDAISCMETGRYNEAIAIFEEIGDYKDAGYKIKESKYELALILQEEGAKNQAFVLLADLENTDTVRQMKIDLLKDIMMEGESSTISGGSNHLVGLRNDGTVAVAGDDFYGECDVYDWRNIVKVSAGNAHTVGLKSDGTIVATGHNDYGQCDVDDWEDIVSISAKSNYTVGLKSDGTVVAAGLNDYGRCDVGDWTDIVAVSANETHTIGLRSDGTVVATGSNESGQCNVTEWSGIIAIATGYNCSIGFKADGTYVLSKVEDTANSTLLPDYIYEKLDGLYNQTKENSGLKSVIVKDNYTVGLKTDGTIVVADNDDVKYYTDKWTDVVAITTTANNVYGLKSDGTVVASSDYATEVIDWENIKIPECE